MQVSGYLGIFPSAEVNILILMLESCFMHGPYLREICTVVVNSVMFLFDEKAVHISVLNIRLLF